MKLAVKIAFLIVSLLTLAGRNAQAQCQINAYPSYSTSNSFAMTNPASDGSSQLVQTVVVDGSTSMSMTASGNCPDGIISQFNNNVSSITHYDYVTNTIGSIGGTTSESVCGVCYESYSTSTISDPLLPGAGTSGTAGGLVYCTALGSTIFASSWNQYFQFAFTWLLTNGLPILVGENYIYPVKNNCSNGTPDYYPSTAVVWEGVPSASAQKTIETGAFQVRLNPANYWTTLPGLDGTITSYPVVYPPEPCTHTGPQP